MLGVTDTVPEKTDKNETHRQARTRLPVVSVSLASRPWVPKGLSTEMPRPGFRSCFPPAVFV